jgi:curved DNA-binding protein CbpA
MGLYEKENYSKDFKNWLNNDYYHLLDIEPTADQNEINRAFRMKIKDCNPLLYPELSEQRIFIEARLKQLIEARETLTDPAKKRQYDEERQLSQECYISYMSSAYNIFEKDKKVIKSPRFKEAPGKKLERLKKYVTSESKAYNQITQNLADEVSDIFLLCMSEHDYQQQA